MQISRQSYHINNVTIAAGIISKNRDLRRSDEAAFNLKLLSAILKTILRQNLLFSVAVLISMLDVSCDSVSSYIWTLGEMLNKIT